MAIKPMAYYKPNNKRRMTDKNDSDNDIASLIIVMAILVLMSISFLVIVINQRETIRLSVIERELLHYRNASLEQKYEDVILGSSILAIKNELLKKEILDIISKRVKVTGYHPDSGGINSDSNPNMTATMTPHKAGYTCAISTKLVELGWLGKEIYIDGFGIVLANDRLARGIPGYQIDLCKGTYKQAMIVGENFNVLASLVSRSAIKQKLEEN